MREVAEQMNRGFSAFFLTNAYVRGVEISNVISDSVGITISHPNELIKSYQSPPSELQSERRNPLPPLLCARCGSA